MPGHRLFDEWAKTQYPPKEYNYLPDASPARELINETRRRLADFIWHWQKLEKNKYIKIIEEAPARIETITREIIKPFEKIVYRDSKPDVRYIPTNPYDRSQKKWKLPLNEDIKLPKLPQSKLPKAADSQTAYQTPIGHSIDLHLPFSATSLGHLLYTPVTATKEKIALIENSFDEDEFNKANETALESILKRIVKQQTGFDLEGTDNFFDFGVLITPDYLKGFVGDAKLIYGLKALSLLSHNYTHRAVNAYQPVRTTVAMSIELVTEEAKGELLYPEENEPFTVQSAALLKNIYRILGGDKWHSQEYDGWNIDFDLALGAAGETSYDDDGNSVTFNFTDLMQANLHSLAIVHGRLGLSDYPVTVPADLTATKEVDKTVDLPSLTRFQSWTVRQLDAILGNYPIKIKIKDSDLLKTGDQELDMVFPNMSEALAEILGLSLNNNIAMDAMIHAVLRNLHETGSNKLISTKTYHLLAACQEYLGFKSKQVTTKVPFTYNPLAGSSRDEPDTFQNAMKPTEMEIAIEENDDKTAIASSLRILLEAAAIIKAANFRKASDLEALKQLYKGLFGKKDDQNPSGEEDFDTWLNKVEMGFTDLPGMTDSIHPYGKDMTVRPQIRQLGENQ